MTVWLLIVSVTASCLVQSLTYWLVFSLAGEKLRPLDQATSFAKSMLLLSLTGQLLVAGVTFSKNSVLSGRCSVFEDGKPVYPFTITAIQCAQVVVQFLLIMTHFCSYNVRNWQPHIKSKESDMYLAVFK